MEFIGHRFSGNDHLRGRIDELVFCELHKRLRLLWFGNKESTSWRVKSAVVWRKVLLVFFIIFELGPYSEPLRIYIHIRNPNVKAFFHPKN